MYCYKYCNLSNDICKIVGKYLLPLNNDVRADKYWYLQELIDLDKIRKELGKLLDTSKYKIPFSYYKYHQNYQSLTGLHKILTDIIEFDLDFKEFKHFYLV